MKDPLWLLDCKPREVQIEALRRSYQGRIKLLNAKADPVNLKLPHYGRPALGWGHFMEMRLGKTATALNEFMLYKRDHGVDRMLVVCPNAFKKGWTNEASLFGLDVPLHVLESNNRTEATKFITHNREGMLVVNYEALVQHATCDLLHEWIKKGPCMIVADESVKIKNHRAVTFNNLMRLSKDASVTRALTGLPSPQSVTDLWSQLRFTRKLDGVNYFAFRAKYAKMGGYMMKKVVGVKNEDDLRLLMNNSSFIASRKDWGEFRESDYDIVDIGMSTKQQSHYKSMEKEFVVWLGDGGVVQADQALSKYMKLQQISSGFILDESTKPIELEPFDSTHKFKHLKEALSDYINGKTIIVAKYRHTVDMLIKHLAEFNPAVIRGQSDMKEAELDVEKEKHRFNNDASCKVLVGQVSAIKYGHTLTGNDENPCSTVVFYENSYSLDDRAQAEQRPQTFVQHHGTLIIDYASTGVERDIIKALQSKKKVSDVILGHYKK